MVPTTFVETTVPRKVVGKTTKEIFVPAINVGTVVPTILVRTAIATRVVGTASKEIFVSAIIVGTVVPTIIVGTVVPTIIVLMAYYWKSCPLLHLMNEKKIETQIFLKRDNSVKVILMFSIVQNFGPVM